MVDNLEDCLSRGLTPPPTPLPPAPNPPLLPMLLMIAAPAELAMAVMVDDRIEMGENDDGEIDGEEENDGNDECTDHNHC